MDKIIELILEEAKCETYVDPVSRLHNVLGRIRAKIFDEMLKIREEERKTKK